MTGHEFRGVDIDLLADYVGGLLDGTPEEASVAALVADDPAWREAHAALTEGMASVAAGLHALGAEPAPMPDDVATRLTAALAELPRPSARGDEPAAQAERAAPAGRHLSAVPDQGSTHPKDASAAGSRRRVRRWAAPFAVAAGALTFLGFGLQNLLGGGGAADTATSSRAEGGYGETYDAPMIGSGEPKLGGPAAAREPAEVPTADRIIASGVDYRRASLARQAQNSEQTAATTGGIPPTADGTRTPAGGVEEDQAAGPALRRLQVREALLACLQAIGRQNGGGPISVGTVDYARFEGAPALIVSFTAGNGEWAWAVGPDCGAPGAGADPRYRLQVG